MFSVFGSGFYRVYTSSFGRISMYTVTVDPESRNPKPYTVMYHGEQHICDVNARPSLRPQRFLGLKGFRGLGLGV